MTNPLGAILAGLGKGASTLGESLSESDLLKAQRRRQQAQDALARLKELDALGAVPDSGMPTSGDFTGTNPTGGLGALRALGQAAQTSAGARRFQLPNAVTGAPESYRIDESETPEAKAMARLVAQQGGQRVLDAQKAKEAHDRAIELETLKLGGQPPRQPVMGSPEWKDAERFRASLRPQDAGPLERVETPNGPRLVKREDAVGQRPAVNGGGSGSPSATAQGVQARLLGAVSEARAAIPRMTAMEQKWLDHPETLPGGIGQVMAKLATRMSGRHDATGIVGETLGENTADPEVLQYLRDAALMARATQLMSSRGGSEAMVNSEQLLNRAVPRDAGLRQSVSAAQKSRNAIFGPVGGLMQALTPEQVTKVEAGLKALDAGDQNGAMIVGSVFDEARAAQQGGGRGGQAPTRRSTDTKPPLADRIGQLKAQGVSKEQAKATLKAEGYPVPE